MNSDWDFPTPVSTIIKLRKEFDCFIEKCFFIFLILIFKNNYIWGEKCQAKVQALDYVVLSHVQMV